MFIYLLHIIPLTAFWALIYFGREDLQPRTIIIVISIWLVSLAAVSLTGVPSTVFAAIEAALDIVLVLILFGGDMKIR
jgi:hypothetical protein